MYEKDKVLKKGQLAIINLNPPDPKTIFRVIPTNFKDEKRYIGKDYMIVNGKKYKVDVEKIKLKLKKRKEIMKQYFPEIYTIINERETNIASFVPSTSLIKKIILLKS